ncbi:hypothetical protein [Pseudoflavonifractor phocaeensis]|uniref:hypothetical protein n=1 Tax=Pseudoflavonifractor phocaeensis TaxID=1870988 RepID=UPI001958D64E|nr:hypothetical protein [Pseudoflavonifractor phocaeensis]MBM6924385.1 hypothetical protein [Pseudoflavonifractor phocaeensis]
MEANSNQGYVSLANGPELMKLLEDVFTDEFMRQHTRFDDFDGFRFSSAVMVNWKANTIVYAPLLLNSFVKESTNFSDWDEMVRTAVDLRYHRS